MRPLGSCATRSVGASRLPEARSGPFLLARFVHRRKTWHNHTRSGHGRTHVPDPTSREVRKEKLYQRVAGRSSGSRAMTGLFYQWTT